MLLRIICMIFISSSLFAIELKTAAQESAPKYFKSKSGTVEGINIDIMDAIGKIDSDIRFRGTQDFLPFKRLKKYLYDGKIDVFFGLKKTDERLKKYIYLDIPLYRVSYVVANRIDDKIKIDSLDDIYRLPGKENILTVYGTSASKFLHSNCRLTIDESAKNPTVLLKMLLSERGRYAFYHDLGLFHIVKEDLFIDKIKILPTKFSTYNHYVAFSKYTSPHYIDKVRVALEKLDKNGTLKKIYMRYHGDR